MFRKLLCIFLLSFIFSSLNAKTIDLQTARQVAEGFLSTRIAPGSNALLLVSSDFTINKNGKLVYYIFNINPQGFIIISANDAAPPVLGYSFENNYTLEIQPENFSLWMEGYASMISYLTENNIVPSEENRLLWQTYAVKSFDKNASTITTVGPLIPCLWNQSAPYNYLCPADPSGSGGHVYSGCVATAMSQVMYYWRYPLQGIGSHGYTWYPYGYLFADFGNTNYKWEEMINGTSTQNFEMAQLQLQLGISVDMMYSGGGSGAYSEDAADALKTYFGYDQSLELVYRDDYAYEDWKSLLRGQLDAGQPMYYHGFGTGGHAFNVDGYQDTMFFHFNWGWGGSYNGYFHLFNLNPGGNSFTQGQGAIINFIPSGNNVVQCGQTDTLSMIAGSLEDGSGPVSPYFNNSACNWLILPGDTLENIKLTFDRFDLEDGKDFIYIHDGPNTDAPLIGSYTGNSIPPVIEATSGSMYIQFVTDGGGTSNGWLASYNAKLARFCSSNITTISAPSGSLSDGSGSYNYRDKSICRYKLQPIDAKSISITFNEFNTAGEDDYLEIYNLDNQTLLYKLYGQTNPGTLNFNTGKLYIVFVTDQQNSASGWDFSYSSSELTGLHEVILGLNVSVFPNPAYTQLQININDLNSSYTLKLISVEGKLFFSEASQSQTGNIIRNIDVSTFPRGIYVLQITSQKGTIYRKVVLN
jgi:hypothetical protein